MTPFSRFVSRKVLAAVAAFAVVAGAVGIAVATAGNHDASTTLTLTPQAQALDAALADPAASPDQTAQPGTTDGRRQLREDLRAAMKLSGDARRSALEEIRAKARAGGYGDRAQRRADRREVRHQLFLDLLPENLQADLKALRDAPADQRKGLREDIRAKALSGGYGADVRKAAEQLQQLRGR